MQLTYVVQALRRRWPIWVAGLALGCVLAAFAWATTETRYEGHAVAIVAPPAVGADGKATNPLNNLGYGSQEIATLATTLMTAADVQEVVSRESGGGKVTDASNELDVRTSSPERSIQITVTTSGSSASSAMTAADSAIAATSTRFSAVQRQMKIPTDQLSRIVTIVPAQAAVAGSTSGARAAGGLLVGTAVLGLVAAVLVDLVLRRKRTADDEADTNALP